MADQGLLKRSPTLTIEEFSKHWLEKHAPKVVPFFLYCKVESYVQVRRPVSRNVQTRLMLPKVHAPITSRDPSVDISGYSGAAEVTLSPELLAMLSGTSEAPAWVVKYYKEVVLADEVRFLESLAMEHVLQVPGGTVEGDRKTIIQDGKAVIDIPETDMDVWKRYERES
ncbi:hypothetical protein BGZ60DRAFT_391607 [Tricladium varicosporioides]|nr:hypothetical protein BGZ60DRAFT_391607 [Hymenoscyphus varicosporioides]